MYTLNEQAVKYKESRARAGGMYVHDCGAQVLGAGSGYQRLHMQCSG